MLKLPRRLGWLLAAAALATAGGAAAPPPGVSVVLLSIDGLRPDHVLEADRYGLRVPNLRRLAREGAYATGVMGVIPTVTYPSHTTMVTGVWPARHGIVANTPLDPLGKNLDGWYWYAEDIAVPTLWDVAGEAGLVTSNVDWPVTAGARFTWNLPQYWRARTPDDLKLHRLLVTPGLLAEAEPVAGPYPPSYEWTDDYDEKRSLFSVFLLERKRPRLHLAYFAGLDHEEHESGPGSPASLAVLERLDALVGRLRAAAEKNGPTVFAVVSDHGFNRTDRELNLNAALREEGLLEVDARGRVASWRAYAWSSGGSAAIVVREKGDLATERAVAGLLDRLQQQPDGGIAQVLPGGVARARGGFPDAAFVVGLQPTVRVGTRLEKPFLRPGAVRGTHGMLPEDRNMESSFFVVGPGIPAGRALGRIDMRDIAPTLAARLGLRLPMAEGRDLLAP